MANNPLKALTIAATAAVGVASAAYGAQKVIVRSLSKTEVDFEFHVNEQLFVTASDGTKLVVYRDGPKDSKKPTLVFLHGYALCSPIWSHQFDLLRDQYDMVAIDLRGHGASDWDQDEEFTLRSFAQDLKDVIDQLELKDIVLVGHSTGGVVSMAYLEYHAEHANKHVKGLCLVSTLAHPPYHHVETLTDALAKFSITGQVFHFIADVPLLGFPMSRFALGKKASNSVTEFVRRCIVSTDRAVCSGVLKMLADFNFRTTLQKFVGPTVVIVGSSDPVTPLNDAKTVATDLGGKEVVIQDVGHAPMLESPDEFNAAFVEFLDKITTL